MSWKEYFDHFAKMNRQQLLDAANKEYDVYSKYIYRQFSSREEGTKFIKRTIFMVIAADREVTDGEVSFLNSFWGSNWTKQDFVDYVNGIDMRHYEREVDKLPEEVMNAYLNIICCIACCDGWLMGQEKDYLQRLWEN